MSHVYSASGSRRSTVFTAIIALHVAIFLVVINDPITVIRNPDRNPGPINVRLPKLPDPVPVPPEETRPIEFGSDQVTEPVIDFSPAAEPDSAATPAEPGLGGEGGVVRPNPPVNWVAAELRGRSGDFASVIRACYPAGARRAGEEGTVIVAVTIGVEGRAGSWRMLQSSGFSRLDAAVPCVLDKLRFNAAREDGRAVQSEARLPIVFRLN